MRLNSSNNTDTDSYCMFWGSEDCRYQNWRLCWSKLETPNHLYSFGGTELFAWPLDISSDSAPTSGTWVFPMHLNVNGGFGFNRLPWCPDTSPVFWCSQEPLPGVAKQDGKEDEAQRHPQARTSVIVLVVMMSESLESLATFTVLWRRWREVP